MPETSTEVPLDRNGRERPIFVTRYPHGSPELDALVALFERGNFRQLQQAAEVLLQSSPSPEVRAAAEDLMRRTAPHRLISLFLVLSVTLFLFFAIWVYTI
jgi:hypothetical protein